MGSATDTKRTVNRSMVKIAGDSFYSNPYDVIDRASLNFFEPKDNSNKFYIAELHQSLSGLGYRLYVNYGRVGRDGVENAQKFDTLGSAQREFTKKVASKVKKGYLQVDLATFNRGSSEGQNKVNADSLGKDVKVAVKSNLSKEVQNFVTHIYAEANQAVSVSISGSSKTDVKAPLGNLGIGGIGKARGVLQEISNALAVKNIDAVRNLSVLYYRNVPRKMPSDIRDESTWILNTQARIQKEMDTLDLYEDTLRLLPVMGTSDIDKKFMALGCDLQYIDKASEEYTYIQHKVDSTHAPNHNFKAKVVNAFRVDQKHAPKFDASCGNVRHLFHGTRNANMVGILSSHLKLPHTLNNDVYITGAMFGSGIYFASNSTKSLNYSRGSFGGRQNKYDTVFLFICEVALGKVYKCTTPQNFRRPPLGYDSVMGVGEDTLRKMIARGEDVPSTTTRLINNEFIIYDENRQRLKYIVEVEINR